MSFSEQNIDTFIELLTQQQSIFSPEKLTKLDQLIEPLADDIDSLDCSFSHSISHETFSCALRYHRERMYEGLIVNTQKNDKKAQQWAMLLHLSSLAGFLVPGAGFIVPIVIWQLKKDDFPMLDTHGKIVTNWLISSLIYCAIFFLLSFVAIGIPLLVILGLLGIVFPIVGGIKASEGKLWKYPLSFTFV
ncbi:MAG: DUF4870 domain-containing protein [Geitlerinemataceae cyanobacterium]